MPAVGSVGVRSENIQHFHGVRIRVVGDGELLMTLYSLDEVQFQELVPFELTETTDIIPFRLANFVTQRAQLEVYTEEINDYFKINRIIIYKKEYGEEYPG